MKEVGNFLAGIGAGASFLCAALCAWVAACFCGHVAAAESPVPESLRSAATRTDFLEGDFVLTKNVPDLGIKAESKGSFSVKKGVGLTWTNRTPTVFVFFASDTYYSVSAGGKTVRKKLDDFDIKGAVAKLFAGDFSELCEVFAVKTLENKDGRIRMSLVPKESEIAEFIKGIDLQFEDCWLKNCSVRMLNGTSIDIVFSKKAAK